MLPIVESRSTEMVIIEPKTSGAHDPQVSVYRHTGSPNVARVLRNLGLIEDNIQGGFLRHELPSRPGLEHSSRTRTEPINASNANLLRRWKPSLAASLARFERRCRRGSLQIRSRPCRADRSNARARKSGRLPRPDQQDQEEKAVLSSLGRSEGQHREASHYQVGGEMLHLILPRGNGHILGGQEGCDHQDTKSGQQEKPDDQQTRTASGGKNCSSHLVLGPCLYEGGERFL